MIYVFGPRTIHTGVICQMQNLFPSWLCTCESITLQWLQKPCIDNGPASIDSNPICSTSCNMIFLLKSSPHYSTKLTDSTHHISEVTAIASEFDNSAKIIVPV